MKPAKWGVLGAIVVLLLTIGGEARADHATEMKAREAFAAGRYDQALDLFAKLYAETLHPVYLRNIGRCHQKMREPQKAIDAFKDYLAKSKKIAPDERAEVEGYIKEMEELRDEQAKAAAPPAPPPPITPLPPAQGPPVTAPPAPPPTTTASANLVSQPPPAQTGPTPIYKKWWFWTAIGVVAAGTVAAILLIPGGVERPECPIGVVKCLP
jgi:hypothetical protein